MTIRVTDPVIVHVAYPVIARIADPMIGRNTDPVIGHNAECDHACRPEDKSGRHQPLLPVTGVLSVGGKRVGQECPDP